MDLTNKEFHVLHHALGLTHSKESYRNHFVTGQGSVDYPICEGLVKKGLMYKRRDPFNEMSEEYIYHATEEGRQKVKEAPPTDAEQAKVETAKPAICKGTYHGSCKGPTECDPDSQCFVPS